ncbi:MutS2 family protein [Eubacterium sp. 14-2]|uniref:endonuclease MutS2 n=1 Tax=Eubacterium sp. 14-2 TaxID=1235790 RepID=UPI000340E34E|nr:endonuclease MutS2 [Eubacterium sp. 14-2]EOT28765.1 MutS2 family protein [Eubacterium sp. 14-2]
MNDKALNTLEYYKIIDMLCSHATSATGRELCRNLKPSTDLAEIQLAQQQTSDALTRIFQKGSLSFAGTHNLGASFKRLEIGGTLSIEELLRVASLLEVAKRARTYSRSEREDVKPDSLDEFFSAIEPLPSLLGEIRRCILSEDEIADDASAALKNIRRSIKNTNEKIRSQMNDMLNSSRNHLQDAVITMRGGRYCLPVKAEAKSQVPGMIHDQSSTGSTIFIEPMAVVKLNNDLRELHMKEQEEIEVILASLSNLAAESVPYLKSNYEILTKLDFIFAKGSLARQYNGSAPVFNQEHRIRIRKGRHPLLDSRKVVPIDIHLGDEFHLLIVTGPNTGGKTVSLKTVGLFTLMGQAGLHIPANDRSELSVFEDVFADIGDEQSIEQNLSTFSSHMTNIITILKNVSENSLVLFDELCAGTDPTEGAALAISILSKLHSFGVRTMATTHYSELKVFALSTPGVENACCEFSVETLSPTYRLLIGIPGKSNAFAISGKLGLPPEIIEDARSRMTEQDENLEDLISDLETSRITMEKERLEAEQYRQETEALKRRMEEKQERLDSQREKIIRQANEEAHAILREAKAVADQTIKNFHKYGQGAATARDMEQERSKLRNKMNSLEKDMSMKQKETANHKVPKKLRIGDSVKVLSMNLKGTVHTLPNDKGDLYVQMGILRSLVNIRDLVLLEEPSPFSNKKKSTGTGKIKMSKSASVSTEINLIGKTTDEAIALLDKYLDDAYLAHMPSVRIVHGKGTGALRKAVHGHLKRLKYVKSFRLGEFGEGDSGVTIAEFS